MTKHNELFEDLIRSSQENTEKLLETYFEIVNSQNGVSDEKIKEVFSEVSENLCTMQATLRHHLNCMKTRQ